MQKFKPHKSLGITFWINLNFAKKFSGQISKKIWEGPSSAPTFCMQSTYFTQTCHILLIAFEMAKLGPKMKIYVYLMQKG